MPECPSLPGRPPPPDRLVLGVKGSVGVSTPGERTSSRLVTTTVVVGRQDAKRECTARTVVGRGVCLVVKKQSLDDGSIERHPLAT